MKKVLNAVAKIGLHSAKSASNKFSWKYAYQPQEPEELKKLKS